MEHQLNSEGWRKRPTGKGGGVDWVGETLDGIRRVLPVLCCAALQLPPHYPPIPMISWFLQEIDATNITTLANSTISIVFEPSLQDTRYKHALHSRNLNPPFFPFSHSILFASPPKCGSVKPPLGWQWASYSLLIGALLQCVSSSVAANTLQGD